MRLCGLLLSTILASTMHAQFTLPGNIPGVSRGGAGDSKLGAGLGDGEIASGVKQALSVGTQNAVKAVARPGGYLDNSEIKILLPPSLRPVETMARGMGQGPRIDGFVDSMNRAAEQAAPEAGHIFGEAVRSMTIDDARALLNGGNTSITDYFKRKTSSELAAAFRPHVEKAMAANGVTKQYDALAASAPKLPFGGGSGGGFNLNTYIVDKALGGLFVMLGHEEQQIRTNPAARSTALLQQVFSRSR